MGYMVGERYQSLAVEGLYPIEHPTFGPCLAAPEEESTAAKQENDDGQED